MLKQSNTPPIFIRDVGREYPTEISKSRRIYSIYLCFCGNEFKVMKSNVTRGLIKSCGCLKNKGTHGLSKHPIHTVWEGIIQRTRNKNSTAYSYYGGRGINICEEWRDFKNFYDDMIDGYEKGLSIDRIDNDKGYEKSNCRWATKSIQSSNTRLLRANNKTGYRGVSWSSARNKWVSQIGVNGKTINLGRYISPIDAAKAYDNYVLDNNLEYTINNIQGE
jgi:hypothetical protein